MRSSFRTLGSILGSVVGSKALRKLPEGNAMAPSAIPTKTPPTANRSGSRTRLVCFPRSASEHTEIEGRSISARLLRRSTPRSSAGRPSPSDAPLISPRGRGETVERGSCILGRGASPLAPSVPKPRQYLVVLGEGTVPRSGMARHVNTSEKAPGEPPALSCGHGHESGRVRGRHPGRRVL